MDTPICDFVRQYCADNHLRLHMPGHKGVAFLGMEPLDITEFDGADSLYEASGIIAKSEQNAGRLFGCQTFYSTEGSSQCIRAMLYLALLRGRSKGRMPWIMAGRNGHKTLISAAALLDFEIDWLYSDDDSYLSCRIDAEKLRRRLSDSQELPSAVYITSPDYLGGCCDIQAIADACHAYDVPLLVDNAHGAYLKFLPVSMHPMDLGADMCCDSAHKTLPGLTGSAYLHIQAGIMQPFAGQAKAALELFGSTSPSYLILQSLDALNQYLCTYTDRLNHFLPHVEMLKKRLTAGGYHLYGDEPLKLTIEAKSYGYTGNELATALKEEHIVCEFADPDYVVLMLTPELGTEGLSRLESTLITRRMRDPLDQKPPHFYKAIRAMSFREALLSPSEMLPVSECVGRILATNSLGCPPAVPILVSGEVIDQNTVDCFQYYCIDHCRVVIP